MSILKFCLQCGRIPTVDLDGISSLPAPDILVALHLQYQTVMYLSP